MAGEIDLAKRIAKSKGLQNEQCKLWVRCVMSELTETIIDGDDVIIPGLGMFRTENIPPRKYRHPTGGDIRTVPEHKEVRFLTAPKLDARVNMKEDEEEADESGSKDTG